MKSSSMRQEPVPRARRAREARAPALDVVRRDVLESAVAERREEVAAHTAAVVAQRRRLADAILLGVPQPFGRGVGEGRARAKGARQRTRLRLTQDLAQPRLRGALRERAVGRPAAAAPRRADPLLHLATSGSRDFAYQTAPRLPSRRKTWPETVGTGDWNIALDLATNSGQSSPDPMARRPEHPGRAAVSERPGQDSNLRPAA